MSKKTEPQLIAEAINSIFNIDTDIDAGELILEAKGDVTKVIHNNRHLGSIRDNGDNSHTLFVVHSGYKNPQYMGVHKTQEDALKELGKFHNMKKPIKGKIHPVQ
jgi:hypothetical protein